MCSGSSSIGNHSAVASRPDLDHAHWLRRSRHSKDYPMAVKTTSVILRAGGFLISTGCACRSGSCREARARQRSVTNQLLAVSAGGSKTWEVEVGNVKTNRVRVSRH